MFNAILVEQTDQQSRAVVTRLETASLPPGIDLAGVVEHSEHPEWTAGDRVLLNGWGIDGEHWGGLAQYARADGDRLTRRPPSLNSHQAMAIGTAGHTAMLSVLALEHHA